MVNVLVAFALMGLTTLAIMAAGFAFLLHQMRLRNRVVMSVRTRAPLRWLVSPRGVARLHRRLRDAVAAAHLAQLHRETIGLGLDDVVAEVSMRALELDRQLLVCDRAPSRVRGRMLRELAAETRELEAITERTIRMARAWSGDRPSERGLGPLRDRLDALESAVRELDGIDGLPVVDTPGTDRLN